MRRDKARELFCIEICPECGEETVIWSKGVTRCSHCGTPMTPCSQCDECDYIVCPYGCVGDERDFDKKPTMPMLSQDEVAELYPLL